ncbi:peptidase M20 [Leptospira perolatii]|uniref:Peptidase M20 n=1 Tax=Leptospira perolatii TaxID=2023191 RepID=A0A2M9ZRC6_9LEPT|nr:M20/M25/M40 family metallo-hydrolase [Leptospira perolatii]PJZ71080.1 peptidase M20 [Leptospira perolatii]PJZ74612.1 peptidase M20 [Leptospira perolatii]
MSLKNLGYTLLALVLLFLLYTIVFTESGIDPIRPSAENYSVDYNKLSEQAASDLQKYLRIKTVRGNEIQGALFLKSILEKRAVPVKIIEYPGMRDRVSLVAELKGKDQTKGGVILTNHIDVVEVDLSEWSVPPFEGLRKGDRIYGRGAIDMKGLGLMQLYAFLLMKDLKIPLEHNLMFLSVADEESRSRFGTRFLLQDHRDLFKGYEFLLNEGGAGSKDIAIKGSKVFNIQHAEKGAVWLDLKVKGDSGHGSTPPVKYAAKSMIDFLEEVQKLGTTTVIHDEAAAFFYELGAISGFPNSFVLRRSRNPLLKLILNGVIDSSRHLRAMTRNTVSITGVDSHPSGINVITSETTGTIDVRVLPGSSEKEMFEKIKSLGEKYGVEVSARHLEPGTSSPVDGSLFRILAGVVSAVEPGAIATPFLSPGTTDSSYFRALGFKCYGLIPVLFTSEEIDGIHGKDESMTVPQLKMGIEILFRTLVEYNHFSKQSSK